MSSALYLQVCHRRSGLTLVLISCNRRGERMRETKGEEKSISRIAMSPSFVSKNFEKGSVLKRRKPPDVP